MPLLLDTSTCSVHFKSQQQSLIHSRLMQHAGQLHVSRLTNAELYALGYRANAKKLEEIDDFLVEVTVLEFDDACARLYGQLHARLRERGRSVGRTDLMIAATAIVHGLVLVTHDQDFGAVQQIIPELRLDDWLA